MSTQTLISMLAALALVLVIVPLLGMLGMMSTGWMMGGMMIGISVRAMIWMLLAFVAVVALMVVLVRQTHHA